MPDHIDDIAIEELQIFDGDELIFDGSDPSTYIRIEPGASAADIIAALAFDDPARRRPRRHHDRLRPRPRLVGRAPAGVMLERPAALVPSRPNAADHAALTGRNLDGWSLRVRGKAGRRRTVPVPAPRVGAVPARHRTAQQIVARLAAAANKLARAIAAARALRDWPP